MKLVRFGPAGLERPGAVDADGQIRDLSAIVKDISGPTLSNAALDKLRTVDLTSLPLVDADIRLGPCVAGVGNFIAVGLNYADHAAETGAAIPEEPILFNKAPSCIVGPNDNVEIPPGSESTDWEVELAVIIGEPTYRIAEADAMSAVAGYCVCHDVSERTYQIHRGGQWMKGKGCPTFGPLGPWLVTRDEVADPQNLSMWLSVNGERMQDGSTRTMIFGIAKLVSHISEFMRLDPGDVITTGTPPGVGFVMTPPRALKAGDVVALEIEGLGRQSQQIVAGG